VVKANGVQSVVDRLDGFWYLDFSRSIMVKIKAFVIKLLPSALVSRLVSWRDYPAYLGRLFRPDNFFAARVYFILSQSINFRENRLRKRLGEEVFANYSTKFPDQKIHPENGYLVCDYSGEATVAKAMNRCLEIANPERLQEELKCSRKQFLINFSISQRDKANQAIFELAADPLVLGPISEYLGSLPVLADAMIWYSPNNSFEYGRSQEFHLDGEDVRQVKCFVHLRDVNPQTGPLTIIGAKESFQLYRSLRTAGLTHARNKKFSDDVIFSHTDAKSIPLCGEKGSVSFIDTCRCYHYGSRPSEKPRLVLVFHYYSTNSADMPVWGRHVNMPFSLPQIPQTIASNVFGFSHHHFPRARRKRNLEKASGKPVDVFAV
jgi:hypothetical protein